MGVSDEAKNVIPLKFLRKIKNKNVFPLVNSIREHTVYTGCLRTCESDLKGIFLSRNGGEKRSEKHSGCNSFLVMNFSN
jgi:hypothetical protein